MTYNYLFLCLTIVALYYIGGNHSKDHSVENTPTQTQQKYK